VVVDQAGDGEQYVVLPRAFHRGHSAFKRGNPENPSYTPRGHQFYCGTPSAPFYPTVATIFIVPKGETPKF
jgi:hypothetical protein